MFSSSSTSASPFQPYLPSSSSNYHPPPPPPPCVNQETCSGNIFLHHVYDPLTGQFSLNHASMAPPAHQTMTHLGVSSNTIPPSINADFSSSCGNDHHDQFHNYYYGNIVNSNIPYFLHSSSKEDVVVPAAAKKDRHSKIFTAQGLRDRRVRLSINVARQFFDLQDLLGFDKASKTLEWLLTKSRKAIKQLGTRNKHLSCNSGPSKSFSSSSQYDDIVPDINEVGIIMAKDKELLMMKKWKESESGVHVIGKESRAKARARARERTREKQMCTTASKSPQILNQLKLFNEQLDDHHPDFEAISSPPKLNVGDHHVTQELGSLLASQAINHHDEDHESLVIKRNKLKSFTVYSNHNQQKYLNVISAESTDPSSNSHIQFPNASHQNWDINGMP